MEQTAPRILEIGLLLFAAALLGWGARRLGLPAVIGYLLTGALVSPFTPGYVANHDQLELLADLGVVLLLFEVGIEINPLRLAHAPRGLLLAVPLQLAITGLAAGGLAAWAGVGAPGAVLVGLSVAMSSSVVVVNVTRSRSRTTDRPTEESMLSWSVVQDLIGVAAALAALIAFGLRPERGGLPPLLAALLFVALAAGAAWLVPRLLRRLRAEHDLFLLVSLASGLLLAGLGSRFLGIPLALAAFVSGLAIGESPDAAEARRRILPFRDLFAVLFFVSLGTLLDPPLLARAWRWLLGLLLLTVVAKVLVVAALARLLQVRGRPWQLAIGLGQVGEFSYVLGSIGLAAGVLSLEVQTALVGAVVLTIAASSVVVRLAGRRPAQAGRSGLPVP